MNFTDEDKHWGFSLPPVFTCMVKTPSSCEDNFFIWSAKTCASSRMENSVSAPQYPHKEKAEHIKRTLRKKTTNEPRWKSTLPHRKAARVLGMETARFPAVLFSMVPTGAFLQPGGGKNHGSPIWCREEREIGEKKKLQWRKVLQLCSEERVSSFAPARLSRNPGHADHRGSVKFPSRRK